MISLIMITCRRLDLFKQALRSFEDNFEDKHLISERILIDDLSTYHDRMNLLHFCPGWNIHFKSIENKGHAKSVRLFRQLVTNHYYFILEDDWLFTERRPYATMALELLHKGYGCVGLIGYADEDGYFEHDSMKSDWPGWTLTPSFHNVLFERTMPEYPDTKSHELEYSTLYRSMGYRSAFFKRTYVKHIGAVSAYTL